MGATIDDALASAAAALRDWVEVTLEQGGEPPRPAPPETLRGDLEIREALANGATLASVSLVRATGDPRKRTSR